MVSNHVVCEDCIVLNIQSRGSSVRLENRGDLRQTRCSKVRPRGLKSGTGLKMARRLGTDGTIERDKWDTTYLESCSAKLMHVELYNKCQCGPEFICKYHYQVVRSFGGEYLPSLISFPLYVLPGRVEILPMWKRVGAGRRKDSLIFNKHSWFSVLEDTFPLSLQA